MSCFNDSFVEWLKSIEHIPTKICFSAVHKMFLMDRVATMTDVNIDKYNLMVHSIEVGSFKIMTEAGNNGKFKELGKSQKWIAWCVHI